MRATLVAWMALVFVLGCSMAVLLAEHAYVFELWASFRWQLSWICALCVLTLLATRRFLFAALACLLTLFVAWPAWKPALTRKRDPPSGPHAPFRVASVNVLFQNDDHASFKHWLATSTPDVLAVQEVTQRWRRDLDDLRDVYPFRVAWPDDAETWSRVGFGLALYSRLPIESSRVVWVPGCWLPVLEALVRCADAPVRVCTLHPPAPHDSRTWQARNEFLSLVPESIDWDESSILLADMNTSSGSPTFAAFLEATGLHDSRRGFGRLPTWKTAAPLAGLWVDLDHILIGSSVHVVERGTRFLKGSDHLAATATLAVLQR